MLYCPICLQYIDNQIFVTMCNHVFHLKCMERCLRSYSTCPICRRSVSATDFKDHIKIHKTNSHGYKWTELINTDGKIISSFPLWM